MEEKQKKPYLVAFTVTKRGESESWQRIGVAFVNKDKSLTIVLNALPLDGRIIIRKPSHGNGTENNKG